MINSNLEYRLGIKMDKAFSFLLVILVSVIIGCLFVVSWQLTLVFLFGSVCLCIIFNNYKLGLYLTILLLPVSMEFYAGGIKIFISEVFILITILAFLHDFIFKRKKFDLSSYYTPFIIAFLILMVINVLFITVDTRKSFLYFLHFLESCFLFYITLNLIKEQPRECLNLVRTIILAAFIQAMIGILQHFTGKFGANFISDRGYLGILKISSGQVWHAMGTIGAFNGLACYLGTCLFILLPLIFRYRKNKYLLFAFLIVLMGFIFTYSRGGLLGLFIGSLFVAYKILSRKSFLIYLTTVILVGSFLFIQGLQDTMYMRTVGYEGRKEIWQRPLDVIKKNNKSFWLGTGANTFEKVVPYPPNIPPKDRNLWFAHNQYILLWQEFGLLGLGLFVAFWITVIFRNVSVKYRKIDLGINIRMSIIGIVVLILCQGSFDHVFSVNYYRNLFFMMLALTESTV